MTTSFNSAALRELLITALSDEDVNRLAYDHFRPVHDQFAAGQSRTQRVQLVVEYCERQKEQERLLARVQEINPARYAEYAGRVRHIPQTLKTLRNPTADFTGRSGDIADLVAHLSQDGRSVAIVGIRGMGGIGKTELALTVAQALGDRYPDAQLDFELQPGSVPLTAEALLAAVIHAFEPEVRLPDELPELQGIYRAVLAGRRGLLLLDNAAGPDQVRPLLPPPAGWAVLVTARVRFPLPGET